MPRTVRSRTKSDQPKRVTSLKKLEIRVPADAISPHAGQDAIQAVLQEKLPEIESWLLQDVSRLNKFADDPDALLQEMANQLNIPLASEEARKTARQLLCGRTLTLSYNGAPSAPPHLGGAALLRALSQQAASSAADATRIAADPLAALSTLARSTSASATELKAATRAMQVALGMVPLPGADGREWLRQAAQAAPSVPVPSGTYHFVLE